MKILSLMNDQLSNSKQSMLMIPDFVVAVNKSMRGSDSFRITERRIACMDITPFLLLIVTWTKVSVSL